MSAFSELLAGMDCAMSTGSTAMTFNSIQYIAFLTIVVLGYYLFPRKARWTFLLAASYFFYACWDARMLIWLLLATVISYGTGRAIGRSESKKLKKTVLISGICSLLLILFVFKYLNFALSQIQLLAGLLHIEMREIRFDWLMPIGLSFYVFQAIGYMADVYREICAPYTHIGKYALYIAFFPHLAEGPIDRTDNLLTQLSQSHDFDARLFREGALLLFFGFYKKVVIADRLAEFVNMVYANTALPGGMYWIASIFYSFQIYCDFSGYTDMAIGSANLMGFNLAENFNTPYLATSIADFWRRWHISLSRWFRDYIYIPLGGSRTTERKWARNVLVVFLISGIWHGAGWNYILWGAAHGLFQVMGKLKGRVKKKIIKEDNLALRIVQVCVTFFLVNLLWVVFRITNFAELREILKQMFTHPFGADMELISIIPAEITLSWVLIGIIIVLDIFSARFDWKDKIIDGPFYLRWLIYLVFAFGIILFGKYGALTADSFIYFQF